MDQLFTSSSCSRSGQRAGKSWEPAPPMSLFLFRLSGGGQYCLNRDPAGRNMPTGPQGARAWTFVRRLDVLPGEVRAGFDPDVVAAAVAQDGYALIGRPSGVD